MKEYETEQIGVALVKLTWGQPEQAPSGRCGPLRAFLWSLEALWGFCGGPSAVSTGCSKPFERPLARKGGPNGHRTPGARNTASWGYIRLLAVRSQGPRGLSLDFSGISARRSRTTQGPLRDFHLQWPLDALPHCLRGARRLPADRPMGVAGRPGGSLSAPGRVPNLAPITSHNFHNFP